MEWLNSIIEQLLLYIIKKEEYGFIDTVFMRFVISIYVTELWLWWTIDVYIALMDVWDRYVLLLIVTAAHVDHSVFVLQQRGIVYDFWSQHLWMFVVTFKAYVKLILILLPNDFLSYVWDLYIYDMGQPVYMVRFYFYFMKFPILKIFAPWLLLLKSLTYVCFLYLIIFLYSIYMFLFDIYIFMFGTIYMFLFDIYMYFFDIYIFMFGTIYMFLFDIYIFIFGMYMFIFGITDWIAWLLSEYFFIFRVINGASPKGNIDNIWATPKYLLFLRSVIFFFTVFLPAHLKIIGHAFWDNYLACHVISLVLVLLYPYIYVYLATYGGRFICNASARFNWYVLTKNARFAVRYLWNVKKGDLEYQLWNNKPERPFKEYPRCLIDLGYGTPWIIFCTKVRATFLVIYLGLHLLHITFLGNFDIELLPFNMITLTNWLHYNKFARDAVAFDNDCYIFGFEFVIDELSMLFIILLALIVIIALFVHYYSLIGRIESRREVKDNEYVVSSMYQVTMGLWFLYMILLFLFTTRDLGVFYVLFELSMLPVFFSVGRFGLRANKMKASFYLFVYTMVSSGPFLVALLLLYKEFGSLHYEYLRFCFQEKNMLSVEQETLFWLLLIVPLATKVPMVPFHVWLPEAHVEASTMGSVILAGLLLKLGVYGMVRFLFPLFPFATKLFTPGLLIWASISMIHASLVIFTQEDMKKIIAYSSIAHMNYALIGIVSSTYEGVQGGLFICFTHGIISSALFVIIGILYDRFHTRLISYYTGVAYYYPVLSTFAFIFFLGNMSFPGAGSFVGELITLLGICDASFVFGFCALFISFITTVYTIMIYTRVFFGTPLLLHWSHTRDLHLIEWKILIFLAFLTIYTGLHPNIFLHLLRCTSATAFINYNFT